MGCILVVDPEQDSRQMLQRLLVGNGHEVLSCSTEKDAITIVKRRRPDIALVYEAAARGWDAGVGRLLKEAHVGLVVIRIANSMHENSWLLDETDEYLLSPVDLETIEAKVRSILEARSTEHRET